MQKVVGIDIILGTAANICFLPKRWVGADEEGPRPPHHSEADQRWSRDQDSLSLVTRERQSGGQELQEQQEQLEQRGLTEEQPSVVPGRVKSEDGLRLQPQQDGDEWVVHEADDVWLALVAADQPAQRSRCLSPPCGEVRPLSQYYIWSGVVRCGCNVETLL